MKDNREILRGIRIPVVRPKAKPDNKGVIHKLGSKTFVSGMEDELAEAFSQEQLDAMVARKDISGNWKSKLDRPRTAGGKFAPATT